MYLQCGGLQYSDQFCQIGCISKASPQFIKLHSQWRTLAAEDTCGRERQVCSWMFPLSGDSCTSSWLYIHAHEVDSLRQHKDGSKSDGGDRGGI